MIYYNLRIIVVLKRNLRYERSYTDISRYLNKCIIKEQKLGDIKNDKELYTFCNLYPGEKDNIYKIGRMYAFEIRSLDEDILINIQNKIKDIKNELFKVVTTQIENNEYQKISKLVSITPAVFDKKKSKNNNVDLNLVYKKIVSNAEKKYEQFYGEKIQSNFIRSIKQVNNKSPKIECENAELLTSTFEIEVDDDEISQKLSFVLLATGILDENSSGFGFCIAE